MMNVIACGSEDQGFTGFKPCFLSTREIPAEAEATPLATFSRTNPKRSNWTDVFLTKIGQIKHTPDNIIVGGFMTCKSFHSTQGSSFNGFVFQNALILEPNMTRELFIAARQSAGII